MTPSSEPVVVPLSKTKLLLLGSIAVVLIAVFVFRYDEAVTVKCFLMIPAGGFFTSAVSSRSESCSTPSRV